MADSATGVLTVSGAAVGGAAIQLTSDPFGVALASSFAGMTAGYATLTHGSYAYPSTLSSTTTTSLLAVGKGLGTVSIEGVSGSSALLVSDGDNLAYTGAAFSTATVAGGSGNDSVTAGSGSAVTIAGGTGNNVIDVSAASQAYVASAGNDHVTAGAGRDTVAIDGSGTRATVSGGSGALTVTNDGSTGTSVDASPGSVRFIGNGGTASVTGGIDTLYGAGGGVFTLQASSHNNVLVGNDASVVSGGAVVFDGSAATGGNQFWAGSGNATLIGGIGADTLVGGTGSATLTGGSGAANMFDLFAADGSRNVAVTISDFAAASGNMITLFDYGEAGVEQALASAVQVGADTHMTLADGTQIVLSDVSRSDVKASDFLFTNPSLG